MNNDEYLSVKTARQILGVSSQTLRNWAAEGKIRSTRPDGEQSHRMYSKQDVRDLTGRTVPTEKKQKIAYCRINSKEEAPALKRQKDFFRREYPDHRLVADIGSGISWKRKGFKAVLERAVRGEVERVLVKHRDRLCTFAFELLEFILGACGVELVVLGDHEDESGPVELAGDLLSIVHLYSSRRLEGRRYTLSEDPDLS